MLIDNGSIYSGGAESCTLYDCLIAGNVAENTGGAFGGTLVNCTVVDNTETGPFSEGGADYTKAGGVRYATLENCIVYYNNALTNNFANFVPSSIGGENKDILNYCCTFPNPASGQNITNAPDFIDLVNGNYRLQTNSPCINAGANSYETNRVDLDGRPRIVGGTVDMGAYEFQGPGIGEFIGWLEQYGLPTDGSVDYADLDGTGYTVYQDWIAGLDPTNATSVLAMLPPTATNATYGLTISWQSVSGIAYLLQRSTNLSAPAFTTIGNITGQTGTTSYTDTTATNNMPYFYRVGATR